MTAQALEEWTVTRQLLRSLLNLAPVPKAAHARRWRHLFVFGCAAGLSVVLAGCFGEGATGESGSPRFQPIDTEQAVFWDRQTTETGELLRSIAEEFNRSGPAVPVKIETTGNYMEIYQKTMASIQARRLPAMAVSYESMTLQYADQGAVANLDRFLSDPVIGLSEEAQADFLPVVLGGNRYDSHGGAMLSFPFAKSVLVLYANHRVLREAGIPAPPKTWEDFLAQCRAIKARTGKYAYAISVDCSTVSAMIFSMGGEIVVNGQLQYDQPASLQAFRLLETLIQEELAYQIPARTFDDESAFAADNVAFTLRTSAGSANMAVAMGGRNDDWSLNPLPQNDPDHPATVLFGPNVTIFSTNETQERAAWQFATHFTSPEVMVKWCLATGYVPFRKSVAETPEMNAFWEAWPSNRVPFDALNYARTEPLLGTKQQEIRKLVEQAESAVLAGLKSGEEAARELQATAQPLVGQS